MASLPELEPELGPEVEIVAKAVPNFGAIAVLIVCAGIVLCVDAICRAFFGTVSGLVGWIPVAGKVITSPIRSIEHKVVSFLGGLEHDIDAAIAHNIHVIARQADKLWHSLELIAANIILLGALATAATFHYAIHPLEKWVRGKIRWVEEELRRLERGLHGATVVIRKTITHVIYPRIKAATVAVPRYLHRELHAIHEDVAQLKKAEIRIEKRLRALTRAVSQKGFLVALAAAIGAASLEAIRCSELGNLFKNKGCSMWSDLAKLLGLVAAFGLALDFRDIVKAAVELDHLGAEAIQKLTILDDAAIKDAASAVSAAVGAIAATPTATGF